MWDLAARNHKLRRECEDPFFHHFRQPLHRFFHPLCGFDVVAFDEWLGVPNGASTAEYVTEHYGDVALAWCYRLIGGLGAKSAGG